jgi:hypothetical protein
MARKLILTFGVIAAGALTAQAIAHPHTVRGREIANGQNHPAFINGVSCADDDWEDNAWYGLETAHHGPDAGDPGKRDGCYETTGRVPPGQDVSNPVIR